MVFANVILEYSKMVNVSQAVSMDGLTLMEFVNNVTAAVLHAQEISKHVLLVKQDIY